MKRQTMMEAFIFVLLSSKSSVLPDALLFLCIMNDPFHIHLIKKAFYKFLRIGYLDRMDDIFPSGKKRLRYQ